MDVAAHTELNHVFEQLAIGKMPNFLELMSAIEDIGAIVHEPDSDSCAVCTDENRETTPNMYPLEQTRCPRCSS